MLRLRPRRPHSVLALFCLLALASAAGVLWSFLPPPALNPPAVLDIVPGSSRWTIARQLAGAGVIRSAVAFTAWSELHRGKSIKAGSYRFSGGQSLPSVFQTLARAQFYNLSLVVPEGFNRYDIARELETRGLASAQAFLDVTASPALARAFDPKAVSLEGYLFPATYNISPRATPAQIAILMTNRFRQELRTLPAPPDFHAWVTLASLVERETPVASERPLIAGIFINRLAKGWPLQCDPTVAYAALLANRYTGSLHGDDLKFPSPYNTYLQPGLPPGPIANPGRAALLAAAHPLPSDYMYFVSDGHGAHRFARTLAQQQKNVALYLQTLRRH